MGVGVRDNGNVGVAQPFRDYLKVNARGQHQSSVGLGQPGLTHQDAEALADHVRGHRRAIRLIEHIAQVPPDESSFELLGHLLVMDGL